MSDFKHTAAYWWADRLELQEERKRFRMALHHRIKKNMVLATDYDPDNVLLAALEEAGITCSGSNFSCKGLLPGKTVMRIANKEISVSEGYGAPFLPLPSK